MRNWNTDVTKFKNLKEKRLWELAQLINYGLDGEKLDEKELTGCWSELKPRLDPDRARMLEFLLWQKAYSLSTNKNFWTSSAPIKTLPLNSS